MRVEQCIVIARTPAEVFARLSNPHYLPRWVSGLESIDADAPLEAGSACTLEMTDLTGARRYSLRLEVRELDSPQRLVYAVSDGKTAPALNTYTLEPKGQGVQLCLAVELELEPAVEELLGEVIAAQVQEKNAIDLRRLKELLESETPE